MWYKTNLLQKNENNTCISYCISYVIFLIGCQSQRYNIDKEKKIIIQTDIVTFYFPLNRVIQYTIKNNDEDIGELYDINKEYVFHADSPSYRINAATLDQYIKLNVALYGITKMLHEKEAIVIDNETSKRIKYKMKLHVVTIGGEGHFWLDTTDSDGRLLLTTTYSSAYDHFLPEKKAIKHE